MRDNCSNQTGSGAIATGSLLAAGTANGNNLATAGFNAASFLVQLVATSVWDASNYVLVEIEESADGVAFDDAGDDCVICKVNVAADDARIVNTGTVALLEADPAAGAEFFLHVGYVGGNSYARVVLTSVGTATADFAIVNIAGHACSSPVANPSVA